MKDLIDICLECFEDPNGVIKKFQYGYKRDILNRQKKTQKKIEFIGITNEQYEKFLKRKKNMFIGMRKISKGLLGEKEYKLRNKISYNLFGKEWVKLNETQQKEVRRYLIEVR